MYTTTVEKLMREMCTSGYLIGAPDPAIDALDSDIVALLRCKECGGKLTYISFHKKGSYRPFTICRECDALREF